MRSETAHYRLFDPERAILEDLTEMYLSKLQQTESCRNTKDEQNGKTSVKRCRKCRKNSARIERQRPALDHESKSANFVDLILQHRILAHQQFDDRVVLDCLQNRLLIGLCHFPICWLTNAFNIAPA